MSVCVWGETEGHMAVEATITPSTDTHTRREKLRVKALPWCAAKRDNAGLQ